VKVVIGAPRLGDKLTRLACKIVTDTGADFAQTAAGDGPAATIEQVELMRDALPEQVAVAAAGRLETLDDVIAMIGAGAARVCTPAAGEVMREMAARNEAG
jgi:deoxyribose-phosphate aldolase